MEIHWHGDDAYKHGRYITARRGWDLFKDFFKLNFTPVLKPYALYCWACLQTINNMSLLFHITIELHKTLNSMVIKKKYEYETKSYYNTIVTKCIKTRFVTKL